MEGYIGEIRMFAATFNPRNWAFCNNQLLPISQNTALFSILGTTYGGNGQTTFALPGMQGRAPVSPGTGPGLSNYVLGQLSGTESTAITGANVPSHTHVIGGTAKMLTTPAAANANNPANNYFANDGSAKYKTSGSGTMKPADVAVSLGAGAGSPVNNMMPYTAINYIICMFGIFPSRN